MTTESIHDDRSMQRGWRARQGDEYVHCSRGIMAHSEAEVGAQANTNGVGTVVVTARMAYHHLRREGTVMDTIIGKYRARIEESCLILTHPTRLSFELTLDEAVELMEFIKVYQAAIAAAQRQTEPSIESVGVDEEFSSDTDGDKVL